MKDSRKLSPAARKRLLLVFILSVLGVTAMAVVAPAVISATGGAVEAY